MTGIQYNEVDFFKKSNEERKEPCKHTRLQKEYVLGGSTGCDICMECGKEGYGTGWKLGKKL